MARADGVVKMTDRAHDVTRVALSFLVAASLLAARSAMAQTCGFAAAGTISGVVNTYYPGVSASGNTVTVAVANAFPAGNPTITTGDMVLLIQMQDAQISAANSANYGSNSGTGSGTIGLNSSGLYEYAVATSAPNGAGTFTIAGANASGNGNLVRSYVTDLTVANSQGQRTFQVVRVPRYASATLASGLTASAWNGRAGGVLAVDVAGTLTLGGATVSVDGLGFRGGVGRALAGAAASSGIASTDYRSSINLAAHGMKGEGIAGTPDLTVTGTDGYPAGDMARGAPGTAGGGGSDGNPVNPPGQTTGNDRNTGGGGGANWGSGGQGGDGWVSDDCPPVPGSPTGGRGGTGVADSTRLLLGGGGGAGTRNNPGPSSGAAGGGMILLRVGAATGTATLRARGTRPLSSANDGGGGGGAGGTIVVVAATGTLAGLAVDVTGGQGGYANLNAPPAPDAPPAKSGSRHGPGGGGGGGAVRLSAAPASSSVAGGASGLTNTCPGDNTTQAYNATAGGSGNLLTSWTMASLSGVQVCTLATRATVLGLSASPGGRVEFATGSQRGTRGFNVYGSDDPAAPGSEPLNAELIAADRPDTSEISFYRIDLGSAPRYLWIEELETSGLRRRLGPYDRDDEALVRALDDVRDRWTDGRARRAQRWREREEAQSARSGRFDGRRGAFRRARQAWSGAVRALRLDVAGPGVARVPVATLVAEGVPEPALRSPGLRLTRLGQGVPFRIEGGELVFEATDFGTDFTDEGAYVLAWGLAAPPPQVSFTRSGLPRLPGSVRVEENRFYAPYLPRETDPWIWDVFFAGYGGPWSFDLPGLRPSTAGAPVRLRVVGGSDTRHRARLSINGSLAGEAEWDGRAAALITGSVGPGVLRESGNVLELVYEGVEDEGMGFAYLDALDLGVDLAPPASAALVSEIAPYDPHLALSPASYVIVAPDALRGAAQRLAEAKRAEGQRPLVVSLERAYDRWSSGVPEPQAVRALLADAHRRGASYAVLLGDDTLDPRGNLGPPPDVFLPSLMGWDGDFGRVASENLYADVDGDGRPELAIGRLPASTPEEADLLVDKVIRQDDLLAAAGARHLFLADRATGFDASFRVAAEGVAARYFAGRDVELADAGEDVARARAELRAALGGGAAVVHFFGHGSPEQWSNAPLLTSSDGPSFEGRGAGSLVLTWACETQWFQYHLGRSVNESLVLARDGGAVAAFGPAGITDPTLQRTLYDGIYAALSRGATLGEAVRRAKADALRRDPRASAVVEGFNLLGDPALRVPAAVSAKGGR